MSDYVADAAAELEDSPVYVDQDASLADANALADSLSGTSIAVAALPDYATETLGGAAAAESILSKTSDYNTVVVVVEGNAFFVASRSGNDDAIATALYENFATSGDVAQAITASIPVMTTGKTGTSTGQPAGPDGSDGIGFVGGASIFIVLALVGAVGAAAFKRYFYTKYGASTSSTRAELLSRDAVKDLPENLRRNLETLEALTRRYDGLNATNVSRGLARVLENSQQLFTRVKRKGGEQQFNMAAVEYTDTFDKLSRALGEDYYMDILAHPDLWDNPEERKDEVLLALESVGAQLIQNIREVNASQDLNFKVALDSLTKALDEVNVTDIYNNKKDS